jgi:hypothetical protein
LPNLSALSIIYHLWLLICLFNVAILFLEHQNTVASTGEQTSTKDNEKEIEENRKQEAEEAKRLTELYLRNQTVFLKKGELMLELDSFYNRNAQQDTITTTTGTTITTTTRRFFDNTLIGRYGIFTDGLELDLIAPVFIHAEVEQTGSFNGDTIEEDGFGDLAAAVRYQAWYERGARPSVIFDVEGKSRTGGSGLTGTGNWNVGGGITLTKSFDPVVFFGRVGYTHNFASQSRDLGDFVDYRIGMGFSLNDRVSFNIQLTGAYIQPSKIKAFQSSAPGSLTALSPVILSTRHIEVMNVFFTTTVMVTKNLFIEPLIGIGLTEQSFTVIGVRIPYRF